MAIEKLIGGGNKYTENFGSKFLPYSSLKEKDGEFEINKFGPTGYYRQDYSNAKYMHLLVAFKKDILKDQKPHQFTNTGKVTIKQLNSEDDPIIKTDESKKYIKYIPLPPKAEFTAPPGNKFGLDKYIQSYYPSNISEKDMEIVRPADKSYNEAWELIYKQQHRSDFHSWTLSGVIEALSETYDPKYGEKDNLDAYKRKTYKAELVDDYLYTGNDYKRELTSEDYELNSVYLTTNDFDYKRISRTEIGYTEANYGKDGITYPSKVYGRRESTGKWEEIASFDFVKTNYSSGKIENFTSPFNVSKPKDGRINIPKGFTSVKWEIETNRPKVKMQMEIDATLKPSEYIQKMFKENETSPGNSKLRIRNDGTLRVINNEGQTIGIPSTTKRNESNSRTLDLDLENYDQEMYHDTAYWDITIKTPEDKVFEQMLSKNIHNFSERKIINDNVQKTFIVPAEVRFAEYVKNDNGVSLREYSNGTFYDLLPIGVSGIKNLKIYGAEYRYTSWDNPYKSIYLKDKNRNKQDETTEYYRHYYLNSNYELIENWQNTGRTLLIAKYDNAELVIPNDRKEDKEPYLKNASAGLTLSYDMIYPWDSYKDYGGNLYNFVAFESGRDSMESGLPDVPNFGEKTEHHKIANKALKDLNKDNDNKNFLYAMDETTVSGNTSANTGLTKHIKDSKDPKYSLATKTREGGQYSYRIRMQSLSGTTTSNLIFYDSIENYNPLKTDEDYGVKRWRGTLEHIDLSHARMRGADPKVYVSTLKGLNMQESKDITDTKIWKPYKEGDDLSNVQAIAVDLRHKPDGSEFKLKEEESVNITLNMRAPWNVKEHQIDPKAKALNEIYANTTITTDLNNKSTNKLINTAYTAIELEPVSTEINLNAIKKYLDKEGKDIALKGNDFKFELRDSDNKVLQTKTNDNKGNITFDPIKYNSWDVGEHTYKIVEVKGGSETTAYDSHEEIVKVNVQREGDSNLKATITYDKDGAAFNNHEVDAITASLEAKKVYIGKGGLEEKPKAGAFEFILKDAEGKEVAKATNDAEGNVVFEGLEFKSNQIGEHKYTIEEVKGKDPTIEYDNTKKNVTVNVSLTKDFKLKADVVYDKGETPTFTNTLKSASLQLVKLKDGSDPFILDEVKDKKGFLTSYKVPEAQKDNVLDGAEYKLYKLTEGKEELVATLITKNGISQVIQDIMPGKYKLKETKAPKGYTLNDKDLIFDITDKDAGTIVAKFATDDGIIDMPSTGGQGTKALMIGGGVLLIAMAGVFALANKKKKEELNK